MNKNATIAAILCTTKLVCADTPVILPDHDKFVKGGTGYLVQTTIPGDFTTLEGIIGALMMLGDQAANKKLTFPFKGLAPLYRGLSKQGNKVILRFAKGADEILSGTSAEQQLLRMPLDATVQLHCPGVEEVLYEIDGKIFVWDA